MPSLKVTRQQILAFRQRTNALLERLPNGKRSLRTAAWAGLQDSMPRAALLSIHARVGGAKHAAWEDPSLVQVWGPRYQVYVVAAPDLPLFTLARLPESGKTRVVAEALADKLEAALAGERMRDRDVGTALGGVGPSLRYATLTGRLAIRWEGARAPHVWIVPPPKITVRKARCELARRYLHVYGPSTAAAFAKWAGVGAKEAAQTFVELEPELLPVGAPSVTRTSSRPTRRRCERRPDPRRRRASCRAAMRTGCTRRAERALLVPNATDRNELWTPRVWPGALLVDGDIVGMWRRAKRVVTIQAWRRLTRTERDAVVAEAESLPLPDEGATIVHWD